MAARPYPKFRSEGILSREIDAELLIHDAAANQTFCLDRTAAATLMACDGRTPVDGILRRLRAAVGDNAFPEDALWVALEELQQRNLLEPGSLPATKYDGLSRRLMLQRLGTAAALAPAILGVAASPAHAQSAIGCGCVDPGAHNAREAGCPCGNNDDCCGDCAGGTCTGATSATLVTAAQCCEIGNLCVPWAGDNLDYCTFPTGRNGRRKGCPCVSDSDCCGGCIDGLCTAMTPDLEATAHGCCFEG